MQIETHSRKKKVNTKFIHCSLQFLLFNQRAPRLASIPPSMERLPLVPPWHLYNPYMPYRGLSATGEECRFLTKALSTKCDLSHSLINVATTCLFANTMQWNTNKRQIRNWIINALPMCLKKSLQLLKAQSVYLKTLQETHSSESSI